eukprot:360063-Rhodomonas_salina.3
MKISSRERRSCARAPIPHAVGRPPGGCEKREQYKSSAQSCQHCPQGMREVEGGEEERAVPELSHKPP